MKTGPQSKLPDPTYYKICLNCYLSFCAQDTKLELYCPIHCCKKYKIKPAQMLEIIKPIGTNRRWIFIQEVLKCRDI